MHRPGPVTKRRGRGTGFSPARSTLDRIVSVRSSLVVLVCWALLLGSVAPAVAGAAAVPGGSAAALDGAVDPPDGAPSAVSGVRSTGAGSAPDGVDDLAVTDALLAVRNNTTVRHRNPSDGSEDGDLVAVREHLAAEMGTIIVDCSRAVGAGAFDPCEGLNGSYGDALSKYVEVSRETTGDGDDESTRSFRRARREGREYARTVREFRETYEAYREARANGNASRAREEARKLRELADEADRTGGNLTRSLGNVTRSGTDVSTASRAINESTANVTRTVEGIEGELFVETGTTARAGSSVASFLDPLVVTGRVTTANGTAIAGARVGLSRIRNGSAEERVRARTRTNETGHYRLSYRPVTVPAGSVTLAVRLLPAVESPYLPSNATVTPRIEQVRAELAVSSAPASAAYGDRFRARVRATAGTPDGAAVAVEGLPVVTRVGEFQIGSGRTEENGEAVPDGRFPAAIRAGERTLVVGFESTGRAIAPATGTVELDVRETETSLSATARRTAPRSVVVEGRLATADGRPLAGRPVRVTLAGRSLGTLRTTSNGSFDGNLTVPTAVLPAEGSAERDVELAFDGSGTNLASTEETATVTLPATAAESGFPLDGTTFALVFVVLLLVTAGGVAVLVRRRGADERRHASRGSESAGNEGPSEPGVDPGSALEEIRAAMETGDYELVTTAGYRAVRRALAGRIAVGPDATHWEFYSACAADGIDPEGLEAVRGLTERFERVAFAPEETSRSVAAASLADVETILGDHPGTDGGTDGADGVGGDARGAPTGDDPGGANRP